MFGADQSTTQIYWKTTPTVSMIIKHLRSVLSKNVAEDPPSSEDSETEGSVESFDTPDMEEVLRENQTADKL